MSDKEEFSLEDIIREFGSSLVETDSEAPAQPDTAEGDASDQTGAQDGAAVPQEAAGDAPDDPSEAPDDPSEAPEQPDPLGGLSLDELVREVTAPEAAEALDPSVRKQLDSVQPQEFFNQQFGGDPGPSAPGHVPMGVVRTLTDDELILPFDPPDEPQKQPPEPDGGAAEAELEPADEPAEVPMPDELAEFHIPNDLDNLGKATPVLVAEPEPRPDAAREETPQKLYFAARTEDISPTPDDAEPEDALPEEQPQPDGAEPDDAATEPEDTARPDRGEPPESGRKAAERPEKKKHRSNRLSVTDFDVDDPETAPEDIAIGRVPLPRKRPQKEQKKRPRLRRAEDKKPYDPKRERPAEREKPPAPTAEQTVKDGRARLPGLSMRVKLGAVPAAMALILTVFGSLSDALPVSTCAWGLIVLLLATAAFSVDAIRFSLQQAKTGMLSPTLLALLASVLVLIDAAVHSSARIGYSACAAVLLWLCQWARYLDELARYRTAKMVIAEQPKTGLYRRLLAWRNNDALFAAPGEADGLFWQNLHAPDLSAYVMRIYVPLAAVLGLALAVIAWRKQVAGFLQAASVLLIAATPTAGILCYARAFCQLTKRLVRKGAALCGWRGAKQMAKAAVILRDEDLFAQQSLEPNGVKSCNGHTSVQVLGFAAAVMNAAGSGLAPVFDELLAREGGTARQCDAIRFYERGGVGGRFGASTVLVGTLGFMRAMGVHMNEEARVRSATYVSVDGELAGLIAIRYIPARTVEDALRMLSAPRIKLLLATCNASITPKMLRAKFALPLQQLLLPPLNQRAELSRLQPEADDKLCAMCATQRVETLANVCAGAKNLRSVVRIGVIISILSGLCGLIVGGILCLMGALETLNALYLLLFMAIWLLPALLLSGWTRNY